MFGVFKKTATPSEFGQAIAQYAIDFLASDAGRSLGMRFSNFDGSGGWNAFLERKGILVSTQKLYFRLYTHCAVQAACTRFDEGPRHAMTHGAISGFTNKLDEYDFDIVYNTLEAAYRGHHRFHPAIEPLANRDAQLTFLPNQNVGVVNAKFLLENFVIPKMPNSEAFFEGFEGYSANACASIGTVRRATDQLLKQLKIA